MGSAGMFLNEMIILYAIACIGFIARKRNIFNQHANTVLTHLVLYITLPALIIYSLDVPFSYEIVKDFLWLVTMSVYILVIAILIAKWVGKKSNFSSMQKSALEGIIIFGNQGFIGYAVCYILLKEQGILYLTMFNIFYLVLIWTYGIYLFTKNSVTIEWKKIFWNPGILATCVGLLIFFSPVRLPGMMANMLETIGKMTIPLSMMMIGSLIAEVKIDTLVTTLKNKFLWQSVVLRLIVIPAFVFVFILLPVHYSLILIAVLVSGMPSAPTISLYAQRFGADPYFSSLGVLLTTSLCVISLPILYILVQYLYH